MASNLNKLKAVPTIFKDNSSSLMMLTHSCVRGEGRKVKVGGSQCFLVNVDVSSGSHSFHTGLQQLRDSAGNVEKFKRKYATQTQTQNLII
ncbi:50S ribosomal subunit protein L31 [Candidatus Tremblaya phenacola PAVE]|nr:50S ribosomal subunit protein L31 [Candidatus Tremblaya phenacola PAVE]